MAADDSIEIEVLKKMLDNQFSIKDLRPPKYFLGIEVARSSKGIFLCQQKYCLNILENMRMLGCRTSTTPMSKILNFVLNKEIYCQIHQFTIILWIVCSI